MKFGNRAARLGAGLCLAFATTMAAQPAYAEASSGAAPAKETRYCLTVVEKPTAGKMDARIVSRTCSTEHAPGSVLPAGVALPAATALLVTFFQDLRYLGSYDTVAGSSGPCDSQGYGLTNLTQAMFNAEGISSYRPNPPCRVASYYSGTNYTGDARLNWVGDQPYVGAPWNDKLYSMKIRS